MFFVNFGCCCLCTYIVRFPVCLGQKPFEDNYVFFLFQFPNLICNFLQFRQLLWNLVYVCHVCRIVPALDYFRLIFCSFSSIFCSFLHLISLNYASLVLKYSLICQVFPCQILCLQNVLWRYFNSTSEHVRSCFVFRLLREDAPRSKMLNFLDTRRPKISPQCFTKMLRGLSIIFRTVVMFAVSL